MRTRVVLPLLAVVVVVAVVAVAVVALATADPGGEVADFGEPPPQGAPPLPADDGLDVHDVEAPADTPPRDAELADGGWPEAAAWIRRETAEGRPVLVNVFASWCVPCRREIPLLLDTATQQPDLAVLGIDHMDERASGEAFVEELGITFPTLYDPAGDVAAAVGARAMPTTVVFDRDGQLVGRVVGELNERNLAELLDAVR